MGILLSGQEAGRPRVFLRQAQDKLTLRRSVQVRFGFGTLRLLSGMPIFAVLQRRFIKYAGWRKIAMDVKGGSAVLALMAALPSEGALLLTKLRFAQTTVCGGLELSRGTLAGKEVVIVFSGLGKINAAAAAAAVLAQFPVSRLWMMGSAGAYPRPNLRLKDVALASEEILGDEGVVTLSSWMSLDAIGIPLANKDEEPIFNRIPVDQVELERARLLLEDLQTTPSIPGVHLGPFVTVSGVSGSPARARLMGDRFGALCENMEGGAAAQVCLRYQVPFLEIRGMSNWAGDRNKKRWYLREALENCQRAVFYLLESWDNV
jgi:futalosine hydrolase